MIGVCSWILIELELLVPISLRKPISTASCYHNDFQLQPTTMLIPSQMTLYVPNLDSGSALKSDGTSMRTNPGLWEGSSMLVVIGSLDVTVEEKGE